MPQVLPRPSAYYKPSPLETHRRHVLTFAVPKDKERRKNLGVTLVKSFPRSPFVTPPWHTGSKGTALGGGADSADADGIFVSAITKDGVADKAGLLRPGDQIVTVDGKSVTGLCHADVAEAINLAKMPPGKKTKRKLSLEVLRDPAPPEPIEWTGFSSLFFVGSAPPPG